MQFSNYRLTQTACLFLVLVVLWSSQIRMTHGGTATTTLTVDICGDGIASGIETCDDGFNLGAYRSSTATRSCLPGCKNGYAPYCGDAVLNPFYGEGCDDGNNTSGDLCSSLCAVETSTPSSGGGGGGGGPFAGGSPQPPRETRVVIQGKAYPNSDVNILKDGNVIGVVEADGNADFYFSTSNITPGVTTFGFWAEDNENLRSVALTTTLTVLASAVTTISGAYIPPTIKLDKRQVARGEEIVISGQSVPKSKIVTEIHSDEEITEEATADDKGKWALTFNTEPLANEEFHTAKSLFETQSDGITIRSVFSQALSFYVGEKSVGTSFTVDLNNDRKVNLVDFSILLFYWNSSGPIGDFNTDQRVNLTDFSILLFNWTG